MVQTPHHGQFLPQALQDQWAGFTNRERGNRCGKAVMSKQRDSTKISSQLHIGNIRTEPLGRERSSCRTRENQLVLIQYKSLTNAFSCLSLLLLTAHSNQARQRRTKVHPGQLQNSDASAGAEQCLPFEGPLCPVLPLLPASSSNPSLQNTPCPCSWESESLTSLLTVWFLQTIHSKHATEGIAPGDTNIGARSMLT